MPRTRRQARAESNSRKGRPPDAEATSTVEFRDVLNGHLQQLGWNTEDLCAASEKYPTEFQHSISRSHMYALLSDEGKTPRVTRGMCNLVAHTLAAHYEARRTDKAEFTRRNLEILLHELLNAAGYAPLGGSADRWGQIMGEYRSAETAQPIRIGYFPWGYFTGVDFPPTCPSHQLVIHLLHVLGIRGKIEPKLLTLEDFYSENLFRTVDMLAPTIAVPARRYTVATSKEIGEWEVGQNLLCANKARIPALPEVVKGLPWLIEQEHFWDKFEVHIVTGGITEMLVDFLKVHLHDRDIKRHLKFKDAIEASIILPQSRPTTGLAKVPALLCDELTATWVADKHHASMLFPKGAVTPRHLAIGLPPGRPEVVAMVNDALDMLDDMGFLSQLSQQSKVETIGMSLKRSKNEQSIGTEIKK